MPNDSKTIRRASIDSWSDEGSRILTQKLFYSCNCQIGLYIQSSYPDFLQSEGRLSKRLRVFGVASFPYLWSPRSIRIHRSGNSPRIRCQIQSWKHVFVLRKIQGINSDLWPRPAFRSVYIEDGQQQVDYAVYKVVDRIYTYIHTYAYIYIYM